MVYSNLTYYGNDISKQVYYWNRLYDTSHFDFQLPGQLYFQVLVLKTDKAVNECPIYKHFCELRLIVEGRPDNITGNWHRYRKSTARPTMSRDQFLLMLQDVEKSTEFLLL